MGERTAKLTLAPDTAVVDVDGTDLASVTRTLEVHAEAGEAPRLVLDLPLHEIQVSGQMQVAVSDRVAEALIALGWTPPHPTGGQAESDA